jgi:prepilin-type N-terminal cleavage/methylation domain-containing protein
MRQRGFSMLELLVVIIIISLLLAVAIDRLLKVQVVAERAAMETIIGHLQSAISLTIGEHVAQDRIPELQRFIDSNPMALLADTPVNYLGSFPARPTKVETASWWFDEGAQTLVYQTGNPEYFVVENGEKGHAKFKIRPVYDDINTNGRFDRGDKLVGLKLTPLYPYRWSNEPLQPAELGGATN